MPKVKFSKMTADDILKIRKSHKLSQVQIANRLGLSLRAYRYYEAEGRPIPRVVENALQALQEPTDNLTTLDKNRIVSLLRNIDEILYVDGVNIANCEKVLRRSSTEFQNVLSKF